MSSMSIYLISNGSSINSVSVNKSQNAAQNIDHADKNAGVYISIILSGYVIGLVVLLLHHVKQKHGQVTMMSKHAENSDQDRNISASAAGDSVRHLHGADARAVHESEQRQRRKAEIPGGIG